MKVSRLALMGALFCSFLAFPQGTPNLTGVWRWNPQKSHRGAGQPPEDMRVKIEQNGADITITFRTRNKGQEETNASRLVIGTADNKNDIHGTPMVSKASWDGTTLLVDSMAKFGTQNLHMVDRWTLSADKQTLTFVEAHQFGAEPQPTEDTTVFERQPDASWDPPQAPKPAEQVYKNIQVMKGVPAPRLMGAMQFFSKSLGVECAYCHVPNEFDKDDKPAKNTARKMLTMVHQINGDNFPQNQTVSCWMCHRGNAKPEAFPK
jgi:hypothetical protein